MWEGGGESKHQAGAELVTSTPTSPGTGLTSLTCLEPPRRQTPKAERRNECPSRTLKVKRAPWSQEARWQCP